MALEVLVKQVVQRPFVTVAYYTWNDRSKVVPECPAWWVRLLALYYHTGWPPEVEAVRLTTGSIFVVKRREYLPLTPPWTHTDQQIASSRDWLPSIAMTSASPDLITGKRTNLQTISSKKRNVQGVLFMSYLLWKCSCWLCTKDSQPR